LTWARNGKIVTDWPPDYLSRLNEGVGTNEGKYSELLLQECGDNFTISKQIAPSAIAGQGFEPEPPLKAGWLGPPFQGWGCGAVETQRVALG
jgi:hypothetical protein